MRVQRSQNSYRPLKQSKTASSKSAFINFGSMDPEGVGPEEIRGKLNVYNLGLKLSARLLQQFFSCIELCFLLSQNKCHNHNCLQKSSSHFFLVSYKKTYYLVGHRFACFRTLAGKRERRIRKHKNHFSGKTCYIILFHTHTHA